MVLLLPYIVWRNVCFFNHYVAVSQANWCNMTFTADNLFTSHSCTGMTQVKGPTRIQTWVTSMSSGRLIGGMSVSLVVMYIYNSTNDTLYRVVLYLMLNYALFYVFYLTV